ncbi:MAG: hypothetical protein R2911_41590 [Caldilineaceae bacterium]
MTTAEVLITVSDESLAQIPALVEKLMEIGLTDIQVMAAVGIITGSLEEDKIAEVLQMPGVAQIQRSQTYHLPPSAEDDARE